MWCTELERSWCLQRGVGVVSAVCQIWAGCQVSALICDCSVNFSYTAGPWQPRVGVHVRVCSSAPAYKVVLDFVCAGAEMVATGQLPSSRHRQGFHAAAAELPPTETASPLFPTGLFFQLSFQGPFCASDVIFLPSHCFFLGSFLLFSLVSRHHYGAHTYPVLYILKPAIIP